MGQSSGIRRFIADWSIPVVGAVGVLVAVSAFAPDLMGSFAGAWLVVVMLLFLGIWIASGQILLSIALWFVPALLLVAAWFSGGSRLSDWAVLLVPFGLLLITFVDPANRWWNALVSAIGRLLLRVSQDRPDRAIEGAAESVNRRLIVLVETAQDSSPDRWTSDLAGIRLAAEDLPTDDVAAARLRRALLALVVAHMDFSAGDSALEAVSAAYSTYREALHRFRSKSLLYRISTVCWHARTASRVN